MFLTSVRVPKVSLPAGLMLTLASQRKLPSCMFAVETPRYWTMECNAVRYWRASSGERRSGLLTISMSGTPDRFTSTSE